MVRARAGSTLPRPPRAARARPVASTVRDQALPFIVPQEYGLHLDTRWVRAGATHGLDVRIAGDRPLAFSALHHSAEDLTAATHAHQLPPARRRSSTSTSPTAAWARSPAAPTPTTASSCTAPPTASAGPSRLDPARVFVRHPSTWSAGRRTPTYSDGRKHSGVTPCPYDPGMAVSVTFTRHGSAALDALAAAVAAAKGDDPLRSRRRHRADEHGRRDGPAGARAARRGRGDRRPHGVPARRAARRPVPARRGTQAGVHTGGRPRRQAGDPRLPRPVRRRQPPPVDRRRPARPVPRAARRRARVADGAGRAPPAGASRRGSPPRWPGCSPRSGTTRATSSPGPPSEPATTSPSASGASSSTCPSGCARWKRSCWPRSASGAASSSSSALTGDADADAGVIAARRVARRRTAARRRSAPAPPPAGDVDVVSTTDADDEVRIAVRAVLDAARAGTRFDRIAVLFPADRPYARLVEHQLAAAGVAWNGRPGTGVGERMVPRVLAELLELDRRGLRRSALMTLLGDVPAATRGRPRVVPTARWERIGRAAGVVREEDWHAAPRPLRRGWRRVDAEADAAAGAARLRRRPARRARRPCRAAPVGGVGQLGQAAARVVVRAAVASTASTAPSARAGSRPRKVLDRLDHLDSIGGPVDPRRVPRHVRRRARRHPGPARQGRRRRPRQHARRRGRPRCRRRRAPRRGRRAACRHGRPSTPCSATSSAQLAGLEGSADRAALVHRQFLAAATTTPARHVTVPRGDLRATATHHQSRWIAPLLDAGGPLPVVIDSHAHGLAATEFPVSAAEHRLRQLWSCTRAGDDVRDLPLGHRRRRPAAGAATRATPGRATEFTEFDGNLTGRAIAPLPATVSPTRIETWAACPHAYFVHYVLGARPIDEPAGIETLSSLDRGSAIHDAIDRLHHAVLDGTLPQPGPAGWTDEHAAALQRAGAEVADVLHAAGRTGRAAFWVNARAELLATLDAWLAFDRIGLGRPQAAVVRAGVR